MSEQRLRQAQQQAIELIATKQCFQFRRIDRAGNEYIAGSQQLVIIGCAAGNNELKFRMRALQARDQAAHELMVFRIAPNWNQTETSSDTIR